MERLQKIAGLTDRAGEINDCKTAYILPIWHVLCAFITYINILFAIVKSTKKCNFDDFKL